MEETFMTPRADAAPFPTLLNAQEVDRKETTLLILSVPCKKTHVTHQTR
jgi:hypothetical protein